LPAFVAPSLLLACNSSYVLRLRPLNANRRLFAAPALLLVTALKAKTIDLWLEGVFG
jgi:hypothetical protein